jgi:putative oxidoreductase
VSSTTSSLSKLSPLVLSILRIVTGLLFVEHGTMKLLDFPASGHGTMPLFSLMGLAGVLELFGGALVTLGLYTRIAAFILSGEMAFAYFMAHFPHSFFPIVNKGEAAILFCFAFLYFAFAGGGSLSVDAKRGKA